MVVEFAEKIVRRPFHQRGQFHDRDGIQVGVQQRSSRRDAGGQPDESDVTRCGMQQQRQVGLAVLQRPCVRAAQHVLIVHKNAATDGVAFHHCDRAFASRTMIQHRDSEARADQRQLPQPKNNQQRHPCHGARMGNNPCNAPSAVQRERQARERVSDGHDAQCSVNIEERQQNSVSGFRPHDSAQSIDGQQPSQLISIAVACRFRQP